MKNIRRIDLSKINYLQKLVFVKDLTFFGQKGLCILTKKIQLFHALDLYKKTQYHGFPDF